MPTPLGNLPNNTLSIPSSSLSQLKLTPDTLISARILSVQNQQVTLQIQEQTLNARTSLPLHPGQQLTFLVQWDKGQWRLIPQQPAIQAPSLPTPLQPLLSPPAQPLQTLLTTLSQQLSQQASLGVAAQGFVDKLQQYQLKLDKRLSPIALKAAIEKSGLFFESRLVQQQPVQQDLKGLLFRLLSQAEDKKDKTTIEQIKKAIRHISHYQARSLVDGWLGVPLLFAPNSPLRDGILWFQPPTETGWVSSHAASWQAIVQLEFKELGPFEALLRYTELPDTPQLEITLWCAHPDLKQRIHAFQAQLNAALPDAYIQWQPDPPSAQLTPSVSLNLTV